MSQNIGEKGFYCVIFGNTECDRRQTAHKAKGWDSRILFHYGRSALPNDTYRTAQLLVIRK